MRRRWFPLAKSLGHRASLVKGGSDGALLLRLDRTISTEGGDSQLVAFFNLESRPQQLPKSEQSDGCLLLRSEDSQFGGARSDDDAHDTLLPFEFWVFGPSRWSE